MLAFDIAGLVLESANAPFPATREEALLSLALTARHLPADVAYREAITASLTSLRDRSL